MGWGGDCVGLDSCTVVMTNNKSVTSTFSNIQNEADLAVSQTTSPNSPNVGIDVTYTVTVTNNGPSGASAVILSDIVPIGATNLRCSDCGQCTFDGVTLNCPVGDLASGSSIAWNLIATPSVTGTLTNRVSATASTPDPNTTNNSATQSTTVFSNTVSVAATDNIATEAGLTTGTYTFTRIGNTAAALTVGYTVAGTATSTSDYVSLGTSVSFPAGITTVTKTVTPTQDTLQELNETVILTLNQSANYAVGSPASATVTLTSDEVVTQTVTVAATDNSATEAGLTTGTYTFTRTGNTAAALTVGYTVAGTATSASDYVSLDGSISFPAGITSVTEILTPIQDTLPEATETVIVNLKEGVTYAVGLPRSATISLASDE